jgi:glycosyltransferase involved in cell wall biosynthesis
MLTTHRLRHTWTRDVDRYIGLTQFAKDKFIEGGLPQHLIAVKPNFVDKVNCLRTAANDNFLFVGRLSPEKGVTTLTAAVSLLPANVIIRVAGDGPLMETLRDLTSAHPNLSILGRLTTEEVATEMNSALALVFPSTWYEGFPMTIVEAFASGLPVIASRLGSMAEIVADGKTGLLFEPGNAEDLAAKIQWATEHTAEMRRMGLAARQEYEQKYTPERNYEMLMNIYRQAIDHARSRND